MRHFCRISALAASTILLFNFAGCTGGEQSEAQTVSTKAPEQTQAQQQSANVDVRQQLASIGKAIPVYPDSTFRADLTKRDEVMIRNQFGQDAQVYTMATDASFPQVWHYYVIYLAQFRGYQPPDPYPAEGKDWRSLQVNLNEAMQDPFVPGDALSSQKNVVLQVAETESEPTTVIRYIVTSRPVGQQQVALQ